MGTMAIKDIHNRLIVEFMGAELGNGTDAYPIVYINVPNFYSKRGTTSTVPLESLRYHDRFDWLMPVVEKIGEMIIPKHFTGDDWDVDVHYNIGKIATIFTIGDNSLFISDSGIDNMKDLKIKAWGNMGKTPLERTYIAVVKFIEWYNEKKQPPNT